MNACQLIYSICVPSQGKCTLYRINTLWSNYDFTITILDEENAFQSLVSQEQLENLAKQYELPFKNYFDIIHSSLCDGNSNGTYLYERNDDTFLISRQEDNVTVCLANFILKTVNYVEVAERFIDKVTEAAMLYKLQLRDSEKEKNIYLSEKSEYAQKLQEFVLLKEEMEQDLYSKFILILNEKKQRIRDLQEMLDAYKSGNVDSEKEMSDMELDIKPKANTLRKREVLSESDSDANGEDYFQMETQVQIEHHKPENEDKCFLDDEVIPSICALPVREKVVSDEINSNIAVVSNANVVDNVVESSKLHEEITISQTQATFNTQDLLDRL